MWGVTEGPLACPPEPKETVKNSGYSGTSATNAKWKFDQEPIQRSSARIQQLLPIEQIPSELPVF
jgi:hypothetical protein